MKKKIRQAYIRGMIHSVLILATIGTYVYFGVHTVEKYFM